MLSSNGNKTAKKISRSNKQKNNNACAAHFYVHFFAIVLQFTVETHRCLKCKISPWLTGRGGCTYRRMDDLPVTPNLSHIPNFFDA